MPWFHPHSKNPTGRSWIRGINSLSSCAHTQFISLCCQNWLHFPLQTTNASNQRKSLWKMLLAWGQAPGCAGALQELGSKGGSAGWAGGRDSPECTSHERRISIALGLVVLKELIFGSCSLTECLTWKLGEWAWEEPVVWAKSILRALSALLLWWEQGSWSF